MLLKKVEIKNFRSLANIKFEMKDYRVIFGKNNEGKSNILKAIKRFWDITSILTQSESRYTKAKGINLNSYMYSKILGDRNTLESDVPIEIWKLKKTNKTVNLTLSFELQDEEVSLLNNQLTSTSRATNYLEILICYNRELECKVSVKLDKNKRSLSVLKNIFITLKYVHSNFSIDYIPSIRTEEHSVATVQDIISKKLKALELSDDYLQAIDKINQLQTELLSDLSETITPNLNKYLKNIKGVTISPLKKDLIRFMRNNYDIIIDDGKKTSLIDKGDGIKSLVALSMLQKQNSESSLLMVDEPEAHLHSGAIRALEAQIKKDTINQQVLVASHHQIFVNRDLISNNLILSSGKLKQKVDIRSIREELGISMGENLINSEFVILVEGETDKEFLKKYIKLTNQTVNSLIQENKVVIDVLRGTKNLGSKLSTYESTLCNCVCILDNDKSAIDASNSAISKGMVKDNQIFRIPLGNRKSAEIENLYAEKFIFDSIDNFFDVDKSIDRKLINNDSRFTENLKSILDSYGRTLTSNLEEDFKWYLIKQISSLEDLSFISENGKLFLDPLLEKISGNFN